jgi:hypothetical protein
MIKKILVISLVAVVAIGVAFSAYNVFAGPASGEKDAVTSSAPAVASDQSLAASAPVHEPASGAAAQGTGRQAGAYAQDFSAQGQSTQGGGQGGRGQGGRGQGSSGQGYGAARGQGAGTGVADPQAAQKEIITLHGVVNSYLAPNFTLLTDDGQSVMVQLGNQRFVSDLGIVLQEGAAVTLTGFYETGDTFAASSLTLDASGQTYSLRDQASGRPLWAGGRNNP